MHRFVKLILIGMLFVTIAAVVILSSVPPVSRDALTHHLAVPMLYLKHGGIYEMPHVVFSYYPMNIELLYLIPLYFGNDIATKYIHFSFALLTAWMIFHYLYKRLNLLYALFGALFFLSLPLTVKLSITVYVDLGLVFFSTASIIYFLKWIEDRFKIKHLIISAGWCGLALGTKYNGLAVLFLLALFVPFIYVRKSQGGGSDQIKAAGCAVIFVAAALLVFSPWMIRNYLWKQNPIYPLYHSWFSKLNAPAAADRSIGNGGENRNSGADFKTGFLRSQPQRIGLFGYRKIVYGESWWEIALVPLRIFFTGKDGDPQHFDGKLTPFLLILPFFAFGRSPNDRSLIETEKRIWLFFSILFLLIAFFTVEMRIRYIAPIVPPLIILSVMGLHRLYVKILTRYSGDSLLIPRAVVTAVTGMLLMFNAAYVMQQFKEVQPINYLSGRVGRDAYIETYRNEYPVVQFANTNLPSTAKILSIFLGNRIYHSDIAMVTDHSVFLMAVKKSDSPQKISMDLRKRGLTHLMVRSDLFDSWIDNNFSEKKKELIKLFFKENAPLICYKNGYGLFRLED